eukprot:478171-Amphidinium_carterae.6
MQGVPGQLGQHQARVVTAPIASLPSAASPIMLPMPPSSTSTKAGHPAPTPSKATHTGEEAFGSQGPESTY